MSDAIQNQKCGIVMPISHTEGYIQNHWSDVRSIIEESVSMADFMPSMVSEADEVNVIHKSIIQNLYDYPIVVCDVSSKNPNVMFELGMRAAFDKPFVIIKDDKTDFSFDTSIIHHLVYPADLRYSGVNIFKSTLSQKIKSTFDKFKENPEASPFLSTFGNFKTVNLKSEDVSIGEFLIEKINDLEIKIEKMSYFTEKNSHIMRRFSQNGLLSGVERNDWVRFLKGDSNSKDMKDEKKIDDSFLE